MCIYIVYTLQDVQDVILEFEFYIGVNLLKTRLKMNI